MKQKERSKLIKKCDTAFSLRIRLRDGRCLYCGELENLQCAHIIPRTYMQTRWDLENALTLCYKHHIFWAHKDPDDFINWLDKKWPGRRQKLRERANIIGDIDLLDTYEKLKI